VKASRETVFLQVQGAVVSRGGAAGAQARRRGWSARQCEQGNAAGAQGGAGRAR